MVFIIIIIVPIAVQSYLLIYTQGNFKQFYSIHEYEYREEYQELLDANKKKILYAEAFIRKWINNADTRLSLAYKQQKIGQKRGKRSRELPKMEKQKFSDDEIVTQLLNNFSSWKELIWAISQKAGKIVILKKKIKFNPEDTESQNELANILEYLGFHN